MEIQSYTKEGTMVIFYSNNINLIKTAFKCYLKIYSWYRRSFSSNGQGEITLFYFQKIEDKHRICWTMHIITWFSYAIRAQPLNFKGYFGIIFYPTTIKQSTTSINDYDINIILKIFCNWFNLIQTDAMIVLGQSSLKTECTSPSPLDTDMG